MFRCIAYEGVPTNKRFRYIMSVSSTNDRYEDNLFWQCRKSGVSLYQVESTQSMSACSAKARMGNLWEDCMRGTGSYSTLGMLTL